MPTWRHWLLGIVLFVITIAVLFAVSQAIVSSYTG